MATDAAPESPLIKRYDSEGLPEVLSPPVPPRSEGWGPSTSDAPVRSPVLKDGLNKGESQEIVELEACEKERKKASTFDEILEDVGPRKKPIWLNRQKAYIITIVILVLLCFATGLSDGLEGRKTEYVRSKLNGSMNFGLL